MIFSKRNIAIGITAVALIAGFFIGRGVSPKVSIPDLRDNALDRATIVISSGSGYPIVWYDKVIPIGANLFEVLKLLAEKNKIEFSYKDYGGSMGVFITSIASSTNTKDKWWQYFVNDKYATVGVSNYKIQKGDFVEFRLMEGKQ